MLRAVPTVAVLLLSVTGCVADFSADALCTADRESEPCGQEGTARCRGGECCAGCFDGVSCRPGDETVACGAAGSMCAGCEGAERCVGGDCLPARVVVRTHTARSSVCAIDDADGMFCWGDNRSGRLGTGSDSNASDRPSRVAGTWRQGALSWGYVGHACGIQSDRSAWCWGAGGDHQLGTGSTASSNVPLSVAADSGPPWDVISVGSFGSCGVREGQLHCWGNANGFQIAHGREVDQWPSQTVPLRYGEGQDWLDVKLGDGFGCGAREGGVLECWGRNDAGQLGRDTGGEAAPPAPVGDGYETFAVGEAHVCAIKEGRLFCWGNNASGQCGQTPSSSVPLPTPVTTETDWIGVAVGGAHSCAIDAEGSAFCWGDNTSGQLGFGPDRLGEVVPTPERLGGEVRWAFLDAGRDHSCGVSMRGVLLCWGSDGQGQQAQSGSAQNVPAPRAIPLPTE